MRAGLAGDATGPAPSGLSTAEARARREREGPNHLPPPRRPSAIDRVGDQLGRFFAAVLWVAAGLAFVAGLPALGASIVVVNLVNALLAAVQERRAERAVERLSDLLPHRVTVRRDMRRVVVDAAEIVRGDVLVLQPGDRVPADASVTVARAVLVDTSVLTGESEPTAVGRGDPLHAGTFLIAGEAEAVVTAVGAATRLARSVGLRTPTALPVTPAARELRRVLRTIALAAVGAGATFLVGSLLLGVEVADGATFAIGVTVALVPEALLPTVTLSLARGAEQMAQRRALVRRLDAVERLGSTTFIWTDTTGTLTRNEMAVVEAWTPQGSVRSTGTGYEPDATIEPVATDSETPAHDTETIIAAARRLALAGTRCSVGHAALADDGTWHARGDPSGAALDAFARRLGIDTDRDRTTSVPTARFPFDPHRRRMSVVVAGEVHVTGAPDTVLPLCRDGRVAGAVAAGLAAAGLRVLAVASRPVGREVPRTPEEAEDGLVLQGLVALEDPPREDVDAAIAACRRAGIRVGMITDDHPATAGAIGRAVGLHVRGATIVSGHELPADDAELGELLDRDGTIVARVSPGDKLRIARALRARGHVVAMTGDAVDDAPALREADVGIAPGRSGTDVARAAADLVLLDDHFATIVAGIEQGRATVLNMRRFLTYHLSDDVAQVTPFLVWALSAGHVPLALGVLQVLTLEVGVDTAPAVALGGERPPRRVLRQPPVGGRLLDATVVRRAFGVLGPTLAVVSLAAFLVSYLAAGWRPGDELPGGRTALAASGAAFLAVVLGQMGNAFASRSTTRWPGELGWTTNRLLVPAVAVALAFSLLLLFVDPLADRLGQAPPSFAGWLVALAAPAAVLAVDAADKRRRRRRTGQP